MPKGLYIFGHNHGLTCFLNAMAKVMNPPDAGLRPAPIFGELKLLPYRLGILFLQSGTEGGIAPFFVMRGYS